MFLSVSLIGGYKIFNLSPNLWYICYRESNLIVIEKCYAGRIAVKRMRRMGNTADIDVWMQELCIGEN